MGVTKRISIQNLNDETPYLIDDPMDREFNRILDGIDSNRVAKLFKKNKISDIVFKFNVNTGELVLNFRLQLPDMDQDHWLRCPKTFFTVIFRTDIVRLLDFDIPGDGVLSFEFITCHSGFDYMPECDEHDHDTLVREEVEKNKLSLTSFLRREHIDYCNDEY